MRASIRLLLSFSRDEGGATAVEYGVLLALVSIFVLVGVANVGAAMKTVFSNVSNNLK